MFVKVGNMISDRTDMSNYMEGFDVYNSELMMKLSDPSLERTEYVINTFEYRPDLIAQDIYGSTKYLGLLLITQSTGLESYKKGTVLRVINKSVLDGILNSL